jgi:acyl-coenzyme A synthetase/AMP-(fatty) acid ligase
MNTDTHIQSYEEAYRLSVEKPEQFWMTQAHEIKWDKFPNAILTPQNNGHHSWFEGGMLNTCYLALDHHIEQGRGNQAALIYDSPVTDKKEQYTYNQLRDKVALLAGVLTNLGVGKGDTVIIYMPAIPQAVMAMLACARIGAIHSVVFGGFASQELAVRIDDAKPKLILSASCGIECQRVIPYKQLLDNALDLAEHQVEYSLIYQRDELEVELKAPRDLDWKAELTKAIPADPVSVESNHPLYILYTSGTTGTPKGIVRDHGGHAVALKYSMKYVYGIDPGEVFWAASDVGWVVGHSYIVYAPLIHGATTILFEGKPIRTPDAGTFWRVISEYKVKAMFTAPTAIRAIRKEDPNGDFIKQFDLSHFNYQFLAGERCDAATLKWAQDHLNVPVIDHWWQTETSWAIVANMVGYGVKEVKPGSSSLPVCGYNLQIVNNNGEEVAPNEEGFVVVKLPLPPSCLRTVYGNVSRFQAGYLERFPGYYFTGDGGYCDEDGYVYITGRIDDVINVAGHRLSTAEIEEVVAHHQDVAECAVIGVNDELRGQKPLAFAVLKSSTANWDTVESEIIQSVRDEVGAIAYLRKVIEVKRLPKTRSGKILRKTMRSIVNQEEYKMPSTIDDPSILDEIKNSIEQQIK